MALHGKLDSVIRINVMRTNKLYVCVLKSGRWECYDSLQAACYRDWIYDILILRPKIFGSKPKVKNLLVNAESEYIEDGIAEQTYFCDKFVRTK